MRKARIAVVFLLAFALAASVPASIPPPAVCCATGPGTVRLMDSNGREVGKFFVEFLFPPVGMVLKRIENRWFLLQVDGRGFTPMGGGFTFYHTLAGCVGPRYMLGRNQPFDLYEAANLHSSRLVVNVHSLYYASEPLSTVSVRSIESFQPSDDAQQPGQCRESSFDLEGSGEVLTYDLRGAVPPFHLE